MSLSHEDVQRLLQLLDTSKFDELHLETEGTKLTLRRNGAGSASLPPVAAASPMAVSALSAAQPAAPSAPAAPLAAAGASQGLIEVRAAMLGTFYGTPKPGEPPFISVGAKVQRDTVIGIIEVMKLMNSIAADVEGEVVEILVRDGELVEYEQVLMRVRPLGGNPQ